MKKLLRLVVLMALITVIMGVSLYAQTVNIPVQIDRRHIPGCGWGGKATDDFMVGVYYRVGSVDIYSHTVTITSGEGNVPYSLDVAYALNATGVKIVVYPSNGIGNPSSQQGLQTIGQSQFMKFTFSLLPTMNPHRCQ